jgi:hypothetical protein
MVMLSTSVDWPLEVEGDHLPAALPAAGEISLLLKVDLDYTTAPKDWSNSWQTFSK